MVIRLFRKIVVGALVRGSVRLCGSGGKRARVECRSGALHGDRIVTGEKFAGHDIERVHRDLNPLE